MMKVMATRVISRLPSMKSIEEVLGHICEYLDFQSVLNLLMSFPNDDGRLSLSNKLHSIHSGDIDELQPHEQTSWLGYRVNEYAATCLKLILGARLRSLKFHIPDGSIFRGNLPFEDSICISILSLMSRNFANGTYSDLEHFVLRVELWRASEDATSAILTVINDIKHSIVKAAKSNGLRKLKTFAIETVGSSLHCPDLIWSLRNHCPLLECLDGVNCFGIEDFYEFLTDRDVRSCGLPVSATSNASAFTRYLSSETSTDHQGTPSSNPHGGAIPWRSLRCVDMTSVLERMHALLYGDALLTSDGTGGTQSFTAFVTNIIKKFHKRTFPVLTELKIRSHGPDLGSTMDMLRIIISACANYYFGDEQESEKEAFVATQLKVLSIDIAFLDANQHFNSSQLWANLVRKYSPLNMYDTDSSYSFHGHAGDDWDSPINSRSSHRPGTVFDGLFPALEVLKCNHWLPSPHLLRLLLGTGARTGSTGVSTSVSTRSDRTYHPRRPPLILEVSPGCEDPCFSSFLLNTWSEQLLPIRTLRAKRRRRLVHGTLTHFTNEDIGYGDSSSVPAPATAGSSAIEQMTEGMSTEGTVDDTDTSAFVTYDCRSTYLRLDEFNDEYVTDDPFDCFNSPAREYYNYQPVASSALYKVMFQGKLRKLIELGITEDFLQFLRCFKIQYSESALRRNVPIIIKNVIGAFKHCRRMEKLYIDLDSQIRKPTSIRRARMVTAALLMFLTGLAQSIGLESQGTVSSQCTTGCGVSNCSGDDNSAATLGGDGLFAERGYGNGFGNTSTHSNNSTELDAMEQVEVSSDYDDNGNDDNDNDDTGGSVPIKDKDRKIQVMIDIPCKHLYSILRKHFLSVLPSLSLAKPSPQTSLSSSSSSSLSHSNNTPRTISAPPPRPPLTITIHHYSQSHTFSWTDESNSRIHDDSTMTMKGTGTGTETETRGNITIGSESDRDWMHGYLGRFLSIYT